MRGWASLCLLFACSACGDAASDRVGGDAGRRSADANPPSADAAAGSPDAAPANPDAAPPLAAVRFVALGDTGEGNEDQYRVAEAIAAKCAADGCDFALLLGDNFYESGVDSVDDPQWITKFEDPYADVDLPFYAVLGNHDYGGTFLAQPAGGIGNEFWKGPIEVDYSARSDKWVMPATHYTFRVENVGFIVLDTNSLLWGNVDHGDQRSWYASALAEVGDADWVIGVGHHPYRSNGAHGNAGNYEGLEIGGIELPNPIPILNGGLVQSFFDEVVCGTVDFYVSGHDHNRQWLDEPDALCGAELLVSGAGAKVKDLSRSRNQAFYQDDTEVGFVYVTIQGDELTGEFIDKNGVSNFTRTVTR